VSPRKYILLAKVFWRAGKAAYWLADWVGEYFLLGWTQKPLDHLADLCMGISAKLLMKGYWDLDPDADWDG
jgi:hypothetical protein